MDENYYLKNICWTQHPFVSWSMAGAKISLPFLLPSPLTPNPLPFPLPHSLPFSPFTQSPHFSPLLQSPSLFNFLPIPLPFPLLPIPLPFPPPFFPFLQSPSLFPLPFSQSPTLWHLLRRLWISLVPRFYLPPVGRREPWVWGTDQMRNGNKVQINWRWELDIDQRKAYVSLFLKFEWIIE